MATNVKITFPHFFILFSLLICSCVSFSNSNHQGIQLFNKLFPDCDLFLLSFTSPKYSSELREIKTRLHKDLLTSSSHFQLDVNIDTNPNETTVFSISTRRFAQCSLVFGIFLENTSVDVEHFIETFKTLLFWPFLAPFKNERDHFIFLTKSDVVSESILKSRKLISVKYKMSFTIDNFFLDLMTTTSKESSLKGRTLCLFCDHGKGEIVVLDLNDTAEMVEIFQDFTKNGQGHTLKFSGPLKYLWLYEAEEVNGEWRSKRGVYKDMLDAILPYFNFSGQVSPSPGHGSGRHFPNGTWNGVMGDLMSGNFDFGVASSGNLERDPWVSFSTPAVYIWVSYMMGPPRQTYSWTAIYKTFTNELWLAVGISTVATIIVVKFMCNFQPFTECELLNRAVIQHITFTLIGVGLPYPDSHSARVLIAIWLLGALIINNVYVSAIVVQLAFPLYQTQPKTFKELVDSNYKWGFDHSGGSLFSHFSTSTSPDLQKIFRDKLPEQDSIDCLNQALNSPNFACLTWTGIADYVVYRNMTLKHGKSPLVLADDFTLFVGSGISLPRRSVLREMFDKSVGLLRDSGQLDKWAAMDLEKLRTDKIHWQMENGMEPEDLKDDDGPELLSLANLLGIFYIYTVGHVLGFGCFAMELLSRYYVQISTFVGPKIVQAWTGIKTKSMSIGENVKNEEEVVMKEILEKWKVKNVKKVMLHKP